jgi:hypothetical protein
MGFCPFNDVAVGAVRALTRGTSRTSIVDYDLVLRQPVVSGFDVFRLALTLFSAGLTSTCATRLVAWWCPRRLVCWDDCVAASSGGCSLWGCLVAVVEGGYDLITMEVCLIETVRVMSGATPLPQPMASGSFERADAALDVGHFVEAPFWPGL